MNETRRTIDWFVLYMLIGMLGVDTTGEFFWHLVLWMGFVGTFFGLAIYFLQSRER